MQPIRAFFAIDLPKTSHDGVRYVIEQLHENRHDLSCRWIEPRHFHITLQFLKEVRTNDIIKMIQNVRETLREIRSFEIELNHIEWFPNSDRPRYISLIPSSNDQLTQVAHCVGEGILNTDYSIETRIFRPHLTVGKIDKIPAQELSLKKIVLHPIPFKVNEIVFYQSNPSEKGPCYTVLERIVLR